MADGNRIPLAGIWGEIQASVRQRVPTSELWRIANEAARERGFEGVSGGINEMGRLRSIAAAMREAASRFAAAAPAAQIDASMFAPDINAQSIIGRSLTPVYRARFLQQVRTAQGVIVEAHRTSSFPVQLPSTKQLLMAELEAAAAAFAEGYGEEHLGIGDIEISVV